MNKIIRGLLLISLAVVFFYSCKPTTETLPRDPTVRMPVSQVLIAYQGAFSAPQDLVRTREEANERAILVRTRILSGEISFEEAVLEYSDEPISRQRQGYVGVIRQGYSVPAIEQIVLKMEPDSVSEPVETGRGFHIFKAETIDYRGFLHMLISHVDAEHVPLGVERSKEEAKQMAQDLLAQVKEGAELESLIHQFSDGNERKRGGYVAAFSPKKFRHSQVWDLEIGEVSDVFEFPFGYHFFMRVDPLPEWIGLKHIMVAYAGAVMSPLSVTRTRDEALQLARDIRKNLTEGADFNELVIQYSDDPSTKKKGGDLGIISWDEVPLEIENVAFRLPAGARSPIVESPGGFHILFRYQ